MSEEKLLGHNPEQDAENLTSEPPIQLSLLCLTYSDEY